MGAALRDLVQHRAPPQRHQVRDPGATPLRTGGVVAAGASTGLRGRQAGHAPALERTSDARLATRHRGLAQPRKGEHSRTAKFRACSLKKTDIFFDKHRRWKYSAFKVAKKLSIAALSKQFPFLDILCVMPYRASAALYGCIR